MWKWLLLALCTFCAINWFILPTFPALRQFISPVSIYSAIGASAILFALSLLFGRGK
jgi:hypothetical protein